MIIERKEYYQEMLRRNRLSPIYVGDRFAGLITFCITKDEHKFDNLNPWDIIEDDSDGHIVYINQMITDKNSYNYKFSFRVLNGFIKNIKDNFPNVKYIFWRRWNKHKNVVRVYNKEI